MGSSQIHGRWTALFFDWPCIVRFSRLIVDDRSICMIRQVFKAFISVCYMLLFSPQGYNHSVLMRSVWNCPVPASTTGAIEGSLYRVRRFYNSEIGAAKHRVMLLPPTYRGWTVLFSDDRLSRRFNLWNFLKQLLIHHSKFSIFVLIVVSSAIILILLSTIVN